jgi:uncharacterized damage-inducible protein DinB
LTNNTANTSVTTRWTRFTISASKLATPIGTGYPSSKAYKQTTDANFSQPVDMVAGVGMGPAKTLRGVILMFNIAHNNEHYGNIVVYTGLKGHVPSSMARTRMPRK